MTESLDPRDASAWSVSLEQASTRAGAKWGRYDDGVLAAWVADMDFAPPAAASAAMSDLIETHALGYPWTAKDDVCVAWSNWQADQFGWEPDLDRVHAFSSVLHAIDVALWFGTKPGDGIAVPMPVYFPFLSAISGAGRRRVEVDLDPDGWRLTAERLDAAIDDGTTAILLCQPHNPTGRMFDADEIDALAEIAERRDLLILSDEIWADLTHARTHRPLASLDARFEGRIVTFGSASKTFNLAGTRCGFAHVDHAGLRATLDGLPAHFHGELSTLGAAAALASWSDGGAWLDETRSQIWSRFALLEERLSNEAPEIGFAIPDATYLAWLDFRNTPLADDPTKQLLDHGRLALSAGHQFGPAGNGWARINMATSEEILNEIIDRIVATLSR